MSKVRAEIVGDRIATRTYPKGRFPGDAEMSKAVPGARWNKDDFYWHYPLTVSTCRSLRATYHDMLEVGPALGRWFRNEQAKTAYLEDLAASQDTALSGRVAEIAPAADAALASRTYQRVGTKFLALSRNVLLADEPGLGKTLQYLTGLIEGNNEIGCHLIVAPKASLRSTWADEVFKWTPFHAFWAPDGRLKRKQMLELFMADEHPVKFLAVNFEMLQTLLKQWCNKCQQFQGDHVRLADRAVVWPDDHYTDAHPETKPKIYKQDWPELFDIEWASVCIDEAHKALLGNRGGNKRTQAAEGFVRLKVRPGGMRIAATGTPLKGKAINFWSIFNWLEPKTYGSKWTWAEAFLDVDRGVFGTTIGDIRPDKEAALYESLRPIMLRRTKREVQPDLPEDLYIDHWVELEGKHAQQYNDLVEEGEAEISGGSISTQGILSEFTRQKQFAYGVWVQGKGVLAPDPKQSPKQDLLLHLLGERGVTGDPKTEFRLEGGAHKYIVGSQFTAILNSLDRSLRSAGIVTDMISGDVTGNKRAAAVKRWQNDADGPRVLLISTMAGGTSLTLDAMCDEMFILDETFVRDDQYQLEGRIRNREIEKRIAVRSYHYIRTRGTIEQEIAESGLSQDEFQKTLLDRSRGVKIKERKLQ